MRTRLSPAGRLRCQIARALEVHEHAVAICDRQRAANILASLDRMSGQLAALERMMGVRK